MIADSITYRRMNSLYCLENLYRLVHSKSSALLLVDSSESNCRNASFTSSSTKFLAEQRPKSHDGEVAHTTLHSLLSSNSFDNAGWFSLLLSTKLITAGLNSNISISSIVKGYSLANSALAYAIDPNKEYVANQQSPHLRHLSWEDFDSIICVIKTSLTSRHILQLTPQQTKKVSVSLLTTFLSSVDRENLTSSIIFRHAVGLPIERIMALEDTLVMDIPIPLSMTKSKREQCYASSSSGQYVDLIVSIFENSLELSSFPRYSFEILNTTVPAVKESSLTSSVKSSEFLFLERLASILKRSKVTLVACQRRIHPYLVQILRRDGIICLPRLSVRYCGALQRLSGARQLVSFPLTHEVASLIEPSSLGYLASIECRTVFGRKYVVASNAPIHAAEVSRELFHDRQHAVLSRTFHERCAEAIQLRQLATSTLILTAPSETLCIELQSACEDIVRTLVSLLTSPYLLPGSGVWQMRTAADLKRNFLKKCLDSQSDNPCNHLALGSPVDVLKASTLFVNCLHDCGRIVSGRSGMCVEGCDAVGALKFDNSHGVDSCVDNHRKYQEEAHSADSFNKGDYNTIGSSLIAGAEQGHPWNGTSFTVEALAPNRYAVQLAVEAATCILDIDGAMRSHPLVTNKHYN
jgi:TCP-1/cpn60 chaperonin family